MLHRIAYRLSYTTLSFITWGLIMLFLPEWQTLGVYAIVGGIVAYLFFRWVYYKTTPKQSYEVDENGHAKPNYR